MRCMNGAWTVHWALSMWIYDCSHQRKWQWCLQTHSFGMCVWVELTRICVSPISLSLSLSHAAPEIKKPNVERINDTIDSLPFRKTAVINIFGIWDDSFPFKAIDTLNFYRQNFAESALNSIVMSYAYRRYDRTVFDQNGKYEKHTHCGEWHRWISLWLPNCMHQRRSEDVITAITRPKLIRIHWHDSSMQQTWL